MTPITTIADLQALPNWVVFDQEPQPAGKKPKKIPYTPGTNQIARVNDPVTWRSHAEASADGRSVGVTLTPAMGLTLIDIDGRIDRDLIATLDSYAETSINGGTHILVRGRPPTGFVAPADIEVYPRDGNRFVLLTGTLIDGRGVIEDRTETLAELFPPRPHVVEPGRRSIDADDQTIIERTLRMPKGRQLHGTADTTGYPSGSEADLALLNCYIAAGAAPDHLDALYRQSALYLERQKRWDDARYRERTIAKALDGYVVPFDGWQRSKIGTVAGKPQDAEYPAGEPPVPLAATGTDGLPDDIPSLKQIIRDLTCRVEAAEHRAQVAEQRARTAEQKVATLSLLQSRTASIIKNKDLGQERFTAVALSHRFAHLETASAPENAGNLHPITLKSVAEVAGVSEDAASRHIGKLVEAGVLRKELRWIPAGVDPETGEITDGHKRQYLGLAGGTVIDFVEAVATLKPERPKRWGGKRVPQCPEHPDADITKRVTFHCAECDRELARLDDETYDPTGRNPQDAESQADPNPCTAASEQSVVTSLRSRTVRFSHSGAELDTDGTTVAAAWAKGQPLPGVEPSPPDYRTDVAYGAR